MSFQYTPLFLTVLLCGSVLAMSCLERKESDVAQKIIAMEKAALDRWGRGDPWGYTEISSEEVTYFDTGTEKRMDGLNTLKKYYKTLEGKIDIDHYEMIDPKVQIHENTAILTFNLIDYEPNNNGSFSETYWSSTEVYSRIDGEWKIVHTHWSKPKSEQ